MSGAQYGQGEPCDLLVTNAYVLTADAKRTKHRAGAIAIKGRDIVAVGPERDVAAKFHAGRTIDARGGMVHPGFIDVHFHVTQHMIGKMIQEVSFEGADPTAWIAKQYTGMNNALEPEEEWANAALASLDMLRNGVTAFVDPGTIYSHDAVADAVASVGTRSSFADPWIIDSSDPAFTNIRDVVPTFEHGAKALGGQLWRNKDANARVKGHLAIYGCGANSLRMIRYAKELAEKNNCAFNMHQSQSTDDAEADDRTLGKHPLVRYEEEGLLSRSCVFVHMNVLRDDEIEPIVRSGISVVWSPTNSWYYGTRMRAPNRIPKLFKRGVNVTLGLDVSKAASWGDQAHMAYLLARDQGDHLSPDDLLHMQTANAARAMGWESWLGSIEPGKRADLVIRSNDRPEAWPRHNPERQHLLLARGKSVDTVIVDGEIVIKAGRHVRLDEGALYERCDRAAKTLRERSGVA
jgi:cytosine/adenosine deaminase-related metal-dependent hydrolase